MCVSRRGRIRYVEWLLEQRSWTVIELACFLHVTTVTVYSDIMLLQTDPPRRIIENEAGRYRIVR